MNQWTPAVDDRVIITDECNIARFRGMIGKVVKIVTEDWTDLPFLVESPDFPLNNKLSFSLKELAPAPAPEQEQVQDGDMMAVIMSVAERDPQLAISLSNIMIAFSLQQERIASLNVERDRLLAALQPFADVELSDGSLDSDPIGVMDSDFNAWTLPLLSDRTKRLNAGHIRAAKAAVRGDV